MASSRRKRSSIGSLVAASASSAHVIGLLLAVVNPILPPRADHGPRRHAAYPPARRALTEGAERPCLGTRYPRPTTGR
jgi:hypothetical protein